MFVLRTAGVKTAQPTRAVTQVTVAPLKKPPDVKSATAAHRITGESTRGSQPPTYIPAVGQAATANPDRAGCVGDCASQSNPLFRTCLSPRSHRWHQGVERYHSQPNSEQQLQLLCQSTFQHTKQPRHHLSTSGTPTAVQQELNAQQAAPPTGGAGSNCPYARGCTPYHAQHAPCISSQVIPPHSPQVQQCCTPS